MGSNGQLGQSTDEEDAWEPGTMLGKQLEQRKVMAVSGGGQHTVLIAQGTCFFVCLNACQSLFLLKIMSMPFINGHAFQKNVELL